LLEQCADINQATEHGTTALMKASLKGHVEVVRLLLEKGANVNQFKKDSTVQPEKYCSTALIFASQKGHVEVVKLLLAYKANPHLLMSNGYSALIAASINGHDKVVKVLLESGVAVDSAKKNATTALIFASRNGHVEVVKLLLKYKAALNFKDWEGVTALMAASQKGHVKIARLLLNMGANLALAMGYGNQATALDIAREYNGEDSDIFKLLSEHPARRAATITILGIGRFRLFANVNVPKEVVKLIALEVDALPTFTRS